MVVGTKEGSDAESRVCQIGLGDWLVVHRSEKWVVMEC